MSHIFFLVLFLTNFYTSVICHSKCKEYIIIMKETSCPTSLSPIREPIKLDDIELNHDNCSEDSSKILSYDKNYSNKSYVVKFDYIGFESICIPIIKSTKLLEHITIEPENITTNKDKEFDKDRHEINETVIIENGDTKTYLLDCLIKNYKQTCNKIESNETLKVETNKTVDITLIYGNKATTNITEFIYNKTEASFLFEQCVLAEYLCTKSNTIGDYTKNNYSMSQIMMTLNGNEDSSVSSPMDNNSTDNFNCTNTKNNHKHINISHVKALIYNIIMNYACQNESINNINQTLSIYNVRVYIPIDLNTLNIKLQFVNCTEYFKSKNNTALSIDCNIVEAVEMHMKEKHYTTTSSNNSLTDALFEEDFNHSLVYHCKFKKVIILKESFSETVEIFNTHKVFDFQNCTEDYRNNDKSDHLDGSKVLIIASEVYKDNFTNLEDFGLLTDNESLKLLFIPNNVSDCSETILLNISKGRIINLWSDDEENLVRNDFNSTLFKLMITNCDNNNTKYLQNDGSLELDIILINKNNASLNESIAKNLKNKLFNSSKRAILNCGYFNQTLQLHNINSVMECLFLESDNNTMTTKVETPISKSPIENKNVYSSEHHNNSFNVRNKGINSTTEKPKENYFGSDQGSKDKGKLRNSKILLKGNETTESNPYGHQAVIEGNKTKENNPEQEMYYISPRVYIIAIVAIFAVVASVLIYALCLFKSEENEYQVTPKRDWSAMDETEF